MKPAGRGEKIALREFFPTFVPAYRSNSWRHFVVTLTHWDTQYGKRIFELNPRRAQKRLDAYVDGVELARARTKLRSKGACAIRFGVEKSGRGYTDERGDFCLVAGGVKGSHLTLFYRSLELIGGFGFDLVLIDYLAQYFDVPWRSVTLHAAQASIFAPKCNDSQTKPDLHRALTEIFHA